MLTHLQLIGWKLKIHLGVLAGVAQWIEYGVINQTVMGLNPSQGTLLGRGPGPQRGVIQEATTH